MEPSVLSTLKTCTIEGCKKYAHANGFCRQHYDEERKSFRVARAAMGEAKEPQARGGRRDKYPASRTKFLNTNGFQKGESGNPYGGGSALDIYRDASDATHVGVEKLMRRVMDPGIADRDLTLAVATLDRIRMNSAQLAFGPNGVPSTLELSADGGVVTPLTKLAASGKGDYESLLAERNRINAELRRIDQERAAERAAQEDQLAAARAAKARGEEIHPALAMLLRVKDDDS